MTPTEVAAILRQFNEWRRCDEDIPQPDTREIGEAIDAAVEMIERLEAAESECLEQARLNGMGSEREAALMAKLKAAEKSDAESIAMYRKARDERDALRAKVSDLTINVEYLGNLKKSYEEFIGKLQDERNDLQTELKEVRYRIAAAHDTIKALRAKIEAMERQESVVSVWRCDNGHIHGSCEQALPMGTKLYALPGAKGEEK